MKLQYPEMLMLHSELEIPSSNTMAVREVLRWTSKISDRQQTTATAISIVCSLETQTDNINIEYRCNNGDGMSSQVHAIPIQNVKISTPK